MSAESNIFVGMEASKVLVTTYRDSFYWRCHECGWLGTGHFSVDAALKEAGKHWDQDHSALPVPTVERYDIRKLAVPSGESE